MYKIISWRSGQGQDGAQNTNTSAQHRKCFNLQARGRRSVVGFCLFNVKLRSLGMVSEETSPIYATSRKPTHRHTDTDGRTEERWTDVDMGTPRSSRAFYLLWLPLRPSRANDPSFLLTGTLLSLLSAPLQLVTPHGRSTEAFQCPPATHPRQGHAHTQRTPCLKLHPCIPSYSIQHNWAGASWVGLKG